MRMRLTVLVVVVPVLLGADRAAAQAPAAAAPTFTRDVAPIFFAQCTTCHRPGEVAPMSLLTYKDARPWARAIATQVKAGTMPPWHADPAIGHFSNERRLTPEQKTTIARWAEAGEVPYGYFVVPANYDEDRWVKAWEVRPGNPAVVHHVIVYLRPPPEPAAAPAAGAPARPRPRGTVTFAEGMDIPAGQTGGKALPDDQRKPAYANARPRPRGTTGSLGGFVPGNGTRVYPDGTAMRLPKGASLVFQMHYTPIGKATTDRTRMGLVFAKEPPLMPLGGTALVNGSLHIPAGAANHRVDAEMTLNRDLLLFSMTPHTHVRGTRWHYVAVLPDGTQKPLLSVPNYDFEWQHEYQFAQPIELPAGTTIKASAWYDNSPANKSNPDATKDVWWGDQTWEEMMFTSFTWHVRPAAPTQQ